MISLAIAGYLSSMQVAFADYHAGLRYAPNIPDDEWLSRDYTRLRESNALGKDWSMLQWSRGPLIIGPEDTGRMRIERSTDETSGTRSEKKFGFGTSELSVTLFASNETVAEACEVLYYSRLFLLTNVSYTYEEESFRSRILHEPLEEFTTHNTAEGVTLFRVSWKATLHVPPLLRSVDGTIVFSTLTKIYTHEPDDTDFTGEGTLVTQFELP